MDRCTSLNEDCHQAVGILIDSSRQPHYYKLTDPGIGEATSEAFVGSDDLLQAPGGVAMGLESYSDAALYIKLPSSDVTVIKGGNRSRTAMLIEETMVRCSRAFANALMDDRISTLLKSRPASSDSLGTGEERELHRAQQLVAADAKVVGDAQVVAVDAQVVAVAAEAEPADVIEEAVELATKMLSETGRNILY